MTTTDTPLNSLVINKLTQAQYSSITPSATEMYLVTDATIAISEVNNLQTSLDAKQTTSNLVTTITSASTDTQYPSAKCMYDIIGNIETTLETIRGV